jgi:RNA polymerase sigma-70 factor (ECF subfamily)
MSFQEPCATVMERVREGDEQAAAEVHRRFVRRLVGLAAAKLRDRAGPRGEEDDVVQSVFRSFFGRHQDAGYAFSDWDAVWGMLAVITVRKCSKNRSFWRAGRRDPRRECSSSGMASEGALPRIVADRQPSPEEAACLAETVGLWIRGMGKEQQRVIRLGLEGWSEPQIARQLGRTERTVRRIRQRAEERLRGCLSSEVRP